MKQNLSEAADSGCSRDLGQLRADAAMLRIVWLDLIDHKFPGCDEWTWFRALSAIKGDNCRRNEDTSQDAALAADQEIEQTYAMYIKALHRFYKARDGERGFLGGRGA